MSPRKSNLTITAAFDAMIFERRADLSPHTIADYRVTEKKLFLFFPSNPPLGALTRHDLIAFFNWLRDEHISQPDGAAPRPAIKLSAKTRRNIHTNLSALYTWAIANGHITDHIIRAIERPSAPEPAIDPLTHIEIAALLEACARTAHWAGSPTTSERHTAQRDRLIIHLLLDTGLRAQELCDIQIKHLNLSRNTIFVPHGKGDKSRTVHFGRRTARLLWEYRQPRLDKSRPDDYLILSSASHPISRHALLRLLTRLGDRAGVKNVHPHRFRHTFATEYLRNGGQMIALQTLLGHSDFEMVRRYAHFVAADVQRDHELASPVDHWKL